MDEKFIYVGTIRLYDFAEALVECSEKEQHQKKKNIDLGQPKSVALGLGC